MAVSETDRLTKTFGATVAVDHLDLRVEAGEVFGFLGPNGAGKTTTIRTLLDLRHPSSGSARVFGLDSRRDNVAIHARCGYLPGELELYPRMTGRRMLDWFAQRARRRRQLASRDELVERFEVTLDRRVHELSKGNRQKLGVVIAFMHRPELLILDEPTSGLDPLMQDEFHRLLRETTAEGPPCSSHRTSSTRSSASPIVSRSSRTGDSSSADTVQALRERGAADDGAAVQGTSRCRPCSSRSTAWRMSPSTVTASPST